MVSKPTLRERLAENHWKDTRSAYWNDFDWNSLKSAKNSELTAGMIHRCYEAADRILALIIPVIEGSALTEQELAELWIGEQPQAQLEKTIKAFRGN